MFLIKDYFLLNYKNKEIPLNYIEKITEFKDFDDITQDEYNLYISNTKFMNNNWNLRLQTIKYCDLDCLVLYQIIDKFSDNIWKLFRIDIL